MNTLANYRIDHMRLSHINAGAVKRNYYPKEAYEHAGFQCDFHLFTKNKFIMNGRIYNREEADAIMAKKGYKVKPFFAKGHNLYILEYNGTELKRWTQGEFR